MNRADKTSRNASALSVREVFPNTSLLSAVYGYNSNADCFFNDCQASVDGLTIYPKILNSELLKFNQY